MKDTDMKEMIAGDLVVVSNNYNFYLSDCSLGLLEMQSGSEYFISGDNHGYDYCKLVKHYKSLNLTNKKDAK